MNTFVSSLSAFPLEVVIEICRQLESPQDRLNLVCCSRQFHKIFTPLLYQKLWVGGDLLRPIVQLSESLAKNPSLAACVEAVHLSAWESQQGTHEADFEEALRLYKEYPAIDGEDEPYDWSLDGSVRLDRIDYGPLYEQAQRVTRSTDKADFWLDELQIGSGDAWIALLLTFLPNLRRLEAEFPFGSLWLHFVMRWAATRDVISLPATSFPPISEAYVDWSPHDVCICAEHVMPFFLLPSMRRFYASDLDGSVTGGDDELSRSTPMYGTSSVTHIEINGCNGMWDLFKVIGSCKNLQTFKYNHRGCVDYKPMELYGALLPMRATLDTIWLDIKERYNRHDDDHQCDDALPSFRDFAVLKTLHLRLGNLPVLKERGPDMSLAQALPPSIETLQIADTGNIRDLQVFAQKLQDHVGNGLESTPALTQIDFKPWSESAEVSALVESMTTICAKADMKFRVCGIPGGRTDWGAAGFAPPPSRPAKIDRF
ncbi:hypothetical protein BJX96DRAFT_185501 [Aspergillus floccosus]